MNIKEAMKEFNLSKNFITKLLKDGIDKNHRGKGYRITPGGIDKLIDFKLNYVKQSEFINQGIFTRSQLSESELIKKYRIFYGGAIGYVYKKSDFEYIKKEISERRKLKNG